MDQSGATPATNHCVRFAPLAVALFSVFSAHAVEISTGDSDLAIRWDNTVKLSTAVRLKSPEQSLLTNPNNDDGDRNFKKGFISERVDLFSEFDAVYQKSLGFRVSGAAWYDQVYNEKNDNPGFPGGAFPNQTSVASDQFPHATRDLHGRKAEILDAFVFAKFDLGGRSATVRAGNHALLWGESLFFGANAIAGGQQPVDLVKLLSVPSTQFKEAVRPVPQVSAQVQLTSNVSVGAYVQERFERSIVPAVGSYFSTSDQAVDGGETILLGAGAPPATRQADLRPNDKWEQGGLQLRVRGDDIDYGFYAIRFDEKTPQLVTVVNMTEAGPAPTGYYLAYPQGITAFGASASKTFGNFNIAVEGSYRHNADLASTQGSDTSGFTPAPATNLSSHPGYAVGNTMHVNVSSIGSLGPNFLWREASVTAEVAWNHVVKITKNAAAVDPNANRSAVAARMVVEPTYRSVLDGVDLGVPVGIGWAPKSSKPMALNSPNAWVPAGGGDMSIGLNGSFQDAWRASVVYTHYLGKVATFNDGAANNAYSWQQTLKDRDFIALSVRYSF